MDYIRYTMRIPEKMFIKEVTLAWIFIVFTFMYINKNHYGTVVWKSLTWIDIKCRINFGWP